MGKFKRILQKNLNGGCRAPADRRTHLAFAAFGVALVVLSFAPKPPALVWNTTPSVPLGIYSIDRSSPRLGDIIVLAPKGQILDALQRLLNWPAGRLLLKPLAARQGDDVCRRDHALAINGRVEAAALEDGSDGRSLPRWEGCRRLEAGELFLLSDHARSFDSRYFGPALEEDVLGIARPLVTFSQGRSE